MRVLDIVQHIYNKTKMNGRLVTFETFGRGTPSADGGDALDREDVLDPMHGHHCMPTFGGWGG